MRRSGASTLEVAQVLAAPIDDDQEKRSANQGTDRSGEVALLEIRHAERRVRSYSPPTTSQMMMFIICVLVNACLLRWTILA